MVLIGTALLFLPFVARTGHSTTRLRAVEVYCPDPTHPRPTSLAEDDGRRTFPPLIYHIQSDRRYPSLRALICAETKLPEAYIDELVAFGAVYASKDARTRPRRVHATDAHAPVPGAGHYCRVHANPRRSLGAVRDVDWASRVLFVADTPGTSTATPGALLPPVVFVDKVRLLSMHLAPIYLLPIQPLFTSLSVSVDQVADCPIAAGVDNAVENMVHQVQRTLPPTSPSYSLTSLPRPHQVQRTLFPHHGIRVRPPATAAEAANEEEGSDVLHLSSRLDVCTSGVVPLTTSPALAARLNRAVAGRDVGKVRRATSPMDVPRHATDPPTLATVLLCL
jgi:hypothetical protein